MSVELDILLQTQLRQLSDEMLSEAILLIEREQRRRYSDDEYDRKKDDDIQGQMEMPEPVQPF